MKRFTDIGYDVSNIVNIYKSVTGRLNCSNKAINQNIEPEVTYFIEPEINQNIVQGYRSSFSFFDTSALEKKEESIEINTSYENLTSAFEQCISDEEDEKISPEKYNILEKK
jgi:hypothetical protein